METIYDKYEVVIGLEVHTQLNTNSKVFSSDQNKFGCSPNSNISVISLGHPGTLPKLNEAVIDAGIKIGLALDCDISYENHFDRKNYFYADLPKGYQITQDATPICRNGSVKIKDAEGNDKIINLTRIHIEEDAGKSIHDIDPENTLIDLNRAGTPLLEIVSEPEISSGIEASNYVAEIRKLVRYLDICDGNMEEGSLRCDVNISVRLKGESKLGTRAEVKNMNSVRNVQRAVDYEVKRQIELIESGGTVQQETRSFVAANNTTVPMREKEMANDYRYFADPDLQPFYIEQEHIQRIKEELPILPAELIDKYTYKLGLSEYDANVLTEEKDIAFYFEALIKETNSYKIAANWMMGTVKSYLNENSLPIAELNVLPSALAKLIVLIEMGTVSHSVATQNIFPMLATTNKDAATIALENNWLQESDENSLKEIIQKVLKDNPKEVERYRKGAKNLVGLFMGKVMKASGGNADPKKANILVREMLEN